MEIFRVIALLIVVVSVSSLEQKKDVKEQYDDCKRPETNKGFSPLCNAAAFGRLEKAKLLVENGADIYESACDKRKPLHIAAAMGHLELVQFFVKKGQNVDDPDENMCTALHYASRTGQLKILEFVVDNGANVNAQNVNGMTPLHLAVIGD